MQRRHAMQGLGAMIIAWASGLLRPSTTQATTQGGGLLEYGEDGLPVHGSSIEGSPYYDWTGTRTIVTVDGRQPAHCFEFDRREGWILQDRFEHSVRYMDELKQEPKSVGRFLGAFKIHGRVEVRYS